MKGFGEKDYIDYELKQAYNRSFLLELKGMLGSEQALTALKIYKNLTYNCEHELSNLLDADDH